ncbi:MAG: hypothetical protein NTX87_10050, partial [Planctomycetota bacterium]|nr:hypothetical protein [Planctomycetota bacterium]
FPFPVSESRIPNLAAREPRATSGEPRIPDAGSRFPAIGRRLPFWQFPCPLSPVPPPVYLPLQVTNDKRRMTVVPRCFFATSFPQRRMPKSACKKPSNSIKFGSKSIKKATFSVKKRSKRRAFRHAHLNIWVGHPLWR